MAEIEIHVIAWPGQEGSAVMIQEELLESGYKATVIYALSGTEHSPVASDWVVLKGFGYGRIFEKSLSISESDVLFHVHADCSSPSWAEVAKRCHGLFESNATLGVWSPIVDWSSWNLSRTRLGGGANARHPFRHYGRRNCLGYVSARYCEAEDPDLFE